MPPTRQAALLCLLSTLAQAADRHPGPDFKSFLASGATGPWRGASYLYRPSDHNRLDVSESSHEVNEIVCSASGETIVGICETEETGAALSLDRGSAGCTFFSHGSWAAAPPVLAADGFAVLKLCLASRSGVRHRVDVRVSRRALHSCRVAVQGRAAGGGGGSVEASAGALAELDAAARAEGDWEGATRTELIGRSGFAASSRATSSSAR